MQGQQLDVETGLFYNRYRYYDPRVGRYTTQDPIGLRGGVNAYAYSKNLPLNIFDSNGLWPSQYGFYVHQMASKALLPNGPIDIGMVNLGQEWADSSINQIADKAFMHAMRNRDTNESSAAACNKANAFMKKIMQQSFEEKKNGNTKSSSFLFGVALHVLQDATSPAHMGFQAWGNHESPADVAGHIGNELIPPLLNPMDPLWTQTYKAGKAYANGDLSFFKLSCPCVP